MNANRWQRGWVRPTVVVLAGLSVGWLGVGSAQADYIPMDTVYSYYDSGTGGAYLNASGFLDLYIPSGDLPGPYGGWYDGNPSASADMSPGHPGYPFQFRNGAADIPLYIFDQEPGGYIPNKLPDGTLNNVPGAASYLRMDSLWVANGGSLGTAKRPPYVPPPNPPEGYTSFWTGTGEMPGFSNATVPAVDFLSLPGPPNEQSAGSYVVVGVTGQGINPAGTGADIFIQSVYRETQVEKAKLYVTNDLSNFTLVGTLGQTISGTSHPGCSWLLDYYVDLANFATLGITDPVLAIKIEGLDLEGGSPGFDLASVQVSSGSLVPWQQVVIPEPGSGVLLALGMLGFWAWRMRGSARPKKI